MSLPFSCSGETDTLPSGIKVAVARFNANDIIHTVAFSNSLRLFVGGAADAHGVSLQQDNFSNVIKAIAAKKIQAYFLVVAEENCAPCFAGGAVQIPTLITAWEKNKFVHYPAIYYEDTYVSEEFKAIPGNANSQKWKGIGTYFRRARIERSMKRELDDAPHGMIAQGVIGECSADNTPSIRSLKNLGATIAKNETPVLIFENGIIAIPKSRKVPVQLSSLANQEDALPHSNIFVTQWSGCNGEQIAASFTEAISTFTGKPVIRVQMTSNGNLPDADHLQNVVCALINAGKSEAIKRQWVNAQETSALSSMRIHALNEIEIVNALKNIGAEPRLLGQNPMVPIAINFSNKMAVPFIVKHVQQFNPAPYLTETILRSKYAPVPIAG